MKVSGGLRFVACRGEENFKGTPGISKGCQI